MGRVNYIGEARRYPTRVFFTGSVSLLKGTGVCYDADYGTAAEANERRQTYVELPSQGNNGHFAGVLAHSYDARTGGQMIEIYEPGSVCEVAIGVNTVVNQGLITCSASAGDPGRFTLTGFPGRGSAIPLQTVNGQLAGETDGTGVLDATGKVLTGTGFDGVQAGDKVVIVSGEDDGTSAATPGVYAVASVTNGTSLTLATAASDGGTMQVNYYIIRDNPRCLCLLVNGDESGLQEVITPPGTGHATSDTFTVMPGGMTYIAGGVTIATGNARAPLADGEFLGQTKMFTCLGALTTNDAEIELGTDGKQLAVSASTGVPEVLHAASLDAADEVLALRWWGGWQEQYHAGCALATS